MKIRISLIVLFIMQTLFCYSQKNFYDSAYEICTKKIGLNLTCTQGYKSKKLNNTNLYKKDSVFFEDLKTLLTLKSFNIKFSKILKNYKGSYFYKFDKFKKQSSDTLFFSIDFYCNYAKGNFIYSLVKKRIVNTGLWIKNNYSFYCGNDTLNPVSINDYIYYRDFVYPHFKNCYKIEEGCGAFYVGEYNLLFNKIVGKNPTKTKKYN